MAEVEKEPYKQPAKFSDVVRGCIILFFERTIVMKTAFSPNAIKIKEK